ncbi:choice-of-anchor J domain-containing protein [uncultured Psychroserpens sp.]|uniref:T9SS-dependent choice-of-anchor J family protein n=1 Tax=uncultured Psychroserpens sp. TaxID=255436 RepID=UPI0026338C94|nr:choice-of-anchor J domain-containing protein [uncultured Psychroserpens sp.]
MLVLLACNAFSQTTIYLEDFTGQNTKGATGTSSGVPTIDLSGVDWNVDVSDANLTATTDWFRVRTIAGNEQLESRDLDGESIWLSPSIDISGFTNVEFTIDASENNANTLEDNDIVTTQYRIDNGPWVNASTNDVLINDYGNVIISQSGLNGGTLEIRVIFINNAGNERQRIDNILVTGTTVCTTFNLPFNEGFEDLNFPPDCWSTYRGTNGLGQNQDWTSSSLTANTGTNSAFVQFEPVTGGNAQDWLVTPAIDLGTSSSQLRFFARDQFTFDFNTEYTVRISQTSATDISSFAILETYNETQLGIVFNEKTIDLSSYSGIVYIAFVMEQNDGDNWFLDDVSIVELLPCTTPEDISNLSASYFDNTISLQWALSSCYDEILVIAKEGSAVTATPTGDGTNYSADNNFGNGTEITTDEFVVFKGIDNNVDVSNINFGNTYHFEVFTRKGTTWSSGVPISIDINYCTVVGDISFETAITLVDFGDINNATGQGSGYDDFTSLSTSIARGASEDLTVNLNTDGDFTVYSYAWIDWNQDGDFDDINETYDLGFTDDNPDGPTSNSPLTIVVPNDANLGSTRMRILSQFYNITIPTNGPCDGSTDGEIEDYTVTVLPGITYVYDNGWTPSNPDGVATTANDIIIANGDTNFTNDINCNSLTINPGAGLTINSGVVLTAIGDIVLESSSTSYSSLILDGSIVGSVRYERHINNAAASGTTTGNNDLISPPITGQTFGNFRTANSNILSGSISGNTAFLFGPFDTATNSFINYTSANDSNTLEAGIGFRTGSTDNGDYIFTGDIETGAVQINLTSGSSNWNLIGNPYPSYINVDALLTSIINSETVDINAVAIYGYDGSAQDGWTIYNLANTTIDTKIAPGQGFFVEAESVGSFTIDPNMRTTGTDDDFILGRNSVPLQYLKLNLSSTSSSFSTSFYVNDNASLGLDPGYDASVWNTTPPNFSLYSHLVEENTGRAMAIQTIGSIDIVNTIISLGVNASNGSLLNFSIAESSLPETVDIFLIDNQTNTTTLLTNEDYNVLLDTSLSGTGRFFLQFTDSTLGTSEPELADILIYTNPNEKTLFIDGVLTEKTVLTIYDLQGRLLFKSLLDTNTTSQKIDISKLNSGTYIVMLNNQKQSRSKKIIIK